MLRNRQLESHSPACSLRFDWSDSNVKYYVDGVGSISYTKNLPTAAGSILINNWSNGDIYWSAGPPLKDSILSVRSVDMYFNVTDPALIEEWQLSCKASAYQKVCNVPASKGS
ncbi:hypothetical protein TWF694_009046 [Orbilia ellipsospora]|uniref:GH16 domain-containing protein n=1 Tax=Orbilia ellipsospora TaxID=2528407 RepID=A0AAV9XDP7_9PEZI